MPGSLLTRIEKLITTQPLLAVPVVFLGRLWRLRDAGSADGRRCRQGLARFVRYLRVLDADACLQLLKDLQTCHP
ncbi:hypothetical protein FJY68_08780 [candidate division WOR-3 bacterium]|uniref:Uncharacterized protein n=1 Tax=candidate division WOR-3 bacterium TaxID=2052148 RepID=A0A937XHV8_UNCW3|nr:hypothetical protein [candidate division WOR-3 bacterium]